MNLIRPVTIFVFVFIMILLCAYQRSRVTYLGYEITHLERQKHLLTNQIAKVHVEIDRLKSPRRIAKKVDDLELDLHSPEKIFEEMQRRQRRGESVTVVAFNGQ